MKKNPDDDDPPREQSSGCLDLPLFIAIQGISFICTVVVVVMIIGWILRGC